MRRAGSLRGYARHRAGLGLPGGTLRAVQRAIEEGRITTDAARQLPDYARADREWLENTTPTLLTGKAPGNGAAPGAAISSEPDLGVMVSVRDVLAVEKRRELTLWGCLGAAMREVAPKVAQTSEPAAVAELLDQALERAHEALEAQWRSWYGGPRS